MKIVALDIETTNLSALMGRVLCCSFYPITGKKEDAYTFRGDDKPWKGKNKLDDSKLVKAISEEINKYNMIVTWNGKLFDTAFLNARLAKYDLAPTKPQFHLDMMYYAGGASNRIGSKKLVNVQKYFGLTTEKTEIKWDDWQLASSGDKPSMDMVVEHCEADVKVLTEAYWKLLPAVANIHR